MFIIARRLRQSNESDLSGATLPTLLGGMLVWGFCLMCMI